MRQQEKEALQVRIQAIEADLSSQLHDWRKLGKHALWIGGSLGLLYWAVNSLKTQDDSPVEDSVVIPFAPEEEESVLWSMASGVATSVMLTVAKQALLQLIQKIPMSDDQT